MESDPAEYSSSPIILLSLPNEVLEEVLLSPPLRVPDLCRSRGVCRHLRDTVDRLWSRVAKRWRKWGMVSGSTNREWYRLCCERFRCEWAVPRVLDSLSHRCYQLSFTDEDELEVFSTLLDKKTFSSGILLCVLTDVLETPSESANLTEQFYALYGKEYVIRQRLISEWKELLQLPESQQTLEQGAILISQWMRPCHCPGTADIVGQLDSIAETVAEHLLQDSTAEEKEERELKKMRQNAVVRVKEGGVHPVDNILAAINTVLYDQLGYKGAEDDYYELSNSFFDQVLEKKKGIPITLGILYESIARRLGVALSPVNFPQHFVLQIANDKEETASSDSTIIDVYSRGRRLTPAELSSHVLGTTTPPSMVIASPMMVFVRIMNNLGILVQQTNLERIYDNQWLPVPLLSFVYLRLSLTQLGTKSFISQNQTLQDMSICQQLKYNPKQVLRIKTMECSVLFQTFYPNDAIEEMVEERTTDKPIEPKRRPVTTSVKHCVGMIMKHRLYHYRCVIYGWDERCMMSDSWIAQMNVDRHPPGRHQPFYNVLVHDGSSRYAAQANLVDCPQDKIGPIPHWEVGKYFTQFTGKGYIPNQPLQNNYPDDMDILTAII